jgi:hypothetical protein
VVVLSGSAQQIAHKSGKRYQKFGHFYIATNFGKYLKMF